MLADITEFFEKYDKEWIKEFFFTAFGKYRYVHTLSEYGLDCYLSNLRSVDHAHPEDIGCVEFYIDYNLFHLVDYKDPKVFIDTLKRYLALKAFL